MNLKWRSKRRTSLVKGLLCVIALSGTANLWAQVEPVSFQLDNGLRVIVKVDARVPKVITQVWYRIGSSDEVPGQTGLSHVLEHMMFKGTPRVPAGEFSRLVSYFGGDDNAFTTDNYTVYFQQHLANRLPLALELEADRMRNLSISDSDFASEIQVVMEERRMRTEDSPQAMALERFQAIANIANPERVPTIGWMRDLQGLTAADARAWYKKWYAPNNATLVIVGAVDPIQVKKLVQHYFANLPSHAIPPRASIRELDRPGERQMTLRLPGEVPALYLGFNWPSLASSGQRADIYALRLLTGILDEGSSSRLESRLVRTNKAAAISSHYDPFSRGDTLFVITAVPAQGQTLLQLKNNLMQELMALTDKLVTADEIQRVIANLEARNVFAQDDISEQAELLGHLDSAGLALNLADSLPAQLRLVTPEQLRDVAQRYLQRERMTSLFLEVSSKEQP